MLGIENLLITLVPDIVQELLKLPEAQKKNNSTVARRDNTF